MKTLLLICLITYAMALNLDSEHRLLAWTSTDTLSADMIAFCDATDHPDDCKFLMTICIAGGWFEADCQTDWNLFRAEQQACTVWPDTGACDEARWMDNNFAWMPVQDDVDGTVELINALATHPDFGWLENTERIYPEFCGNDLDFVWQCQYYTHFCDAFEEEEIYVCQAHWEEYIDILRYENVDWEFLLQEHFNLFPTQAKRSDPLMRQWEREYFGTTFNDDELNADFDTAAPHVRGRRNIRHLGTFRGDLYSLE